MEKKDNTGKKQANGRNMPPVDTRFGGKRGNKRNTKGRPKNFDQLRALAQKIAALPLSDEDKRTRIEAMLVLMSSSRNPADRRLFLEYAYGKPREEVDITSGGKAINVIEIVKTYEKDE